MTAPAVVRHPQVEQVPELRRRIRDLEAQLRGLEWALADERRRACTDELTGVGNRAGLTAAWEESRGSWAGLLLLDLDRFKPINDTHGHRAGDLVLRQLAARMRRGGAVHRLGGDEFAIVVPAGLDPHHAALAVATDLAAPVDIGVARVVLGASIGVFRPATPGAWPALATALERADTAMYGAKASGRAVRVWCPDDDGQLPTRATRRRTS